jgi:hypothetical protein
MLSTLSLSGPSGSAQHGGPSGCTHCPGDQEARHLNHVANKIFNTETKPTDSDGDAELIRPIKLAGDNQVPAATTKKKCREHRAAEPDALTVDEAVKRGPAGKGKLYQEIAAGRLIARKIGRRTIILRTDYERWLNSLPLLPGAVRVRAAEDLTTPNTMPPRRRGRPRKVIR